MISHQCLEGHREYKVKENENISEIVQGFRVPLEVLKLANTHKNLQNLKKDDIVCIPNQEHFPTCSNGKYYFIQPGDTFFKLSQSFFLPLQNIIASNPQSDPNNLQVGEAICLPIYDSYTYCSENATPYRIKQGDTFYKIAKAFHVSLEEVVKLNSHLNPNQLYIGQIVCLPIKWQFFFEQKNHVAFMYPDNWTKVTKGPHQPIRYEGENGFVEVTGIVAAPPGEPDKVSSLNEVSKQYAYGKFNPYGKKPKIKKMVVNGQPARMIIPSEDQSEDYNQQAAFILKYPHPYYIQGVKNHFLLIYAKKNYIKGIVRTLKLLNTEVGPQHISKSQAEDLVRTYLGLQNQPEAHIEYDHMENGKYVIHVFDIVNNHTSTLGWYYVNPTTGKITNAIL